MGKGVFITIEGPDGSGKTTQIQKIRQLLEEHGERAIITREPGGTVISEKIRDLILDNNNKEMTAVTEALLYAAARAQHVAEVIKPALDRGEWVICDRFVDSSIAYQGYGRDLGSTCVRGINEHAVMGCKPDITFLLKVDPGVGKDRIKEETHDRIEQETMEFHNKVFFGYGALEKEEPNRIIGIDASKSIDEISSEIHRHMERLLS